MALAIEVPAFSRSAIGGKKDSRINFRVPSELKDELARQTRELRCGSEAELAEWLLAVGLFGEAHVAMMRNPQARRGAVLYPERRLSDEEVLNRRPRSA